MACAMDVDKSWVFQSKLGSGGFGVVQLWRNIRTGEEIAVKKCLSTDTQLTPKQKERWVSEVNKMQKLKHPNIIATKPVPCKVIDTCSSLPVLCMEYCRQGDLRSVLNKSENCCGLPEADVIQIIIHIASAVEYLHAHEITHRDLKPENVVLQPLNGKIIYKLIDLGYAKSLGHDSMYASIVGTLNYVAPELLWQQRYSCSVDYWSLGILFYEIITGFRPFLPDESSPVKWKRNIENKSYEDISAEYVDGKVIFHKNIQDPNDMTPCIRNRLVDWFRLVLQWDPKKRGRQCQSNGIDGVVTFKMLAKILSTKIVRVFCVPRYQIYDYEVGNDTTLRLLQSLIENDTQIAISSQELINSSGVVLKDNDALQDPFLTLFRKQDVLVENFEPKHPARVQKMIQMPKMGVTKHELRKCYSAAMFYVKNEVKLFRLYILALSMKIDLIISRFDTLLMKNGEVTTGMDLLKNELFSLTDLMGNMETNVQDNWQAEIQAIKCKVDRLTEAASQIKVMTMCDQFSQIRETLTEFGQVDWMTGYEEFLDKALNIIEKTRDLDPRSEHSPTHMAMLIVRFLKFRLTNMHSQKLEKITSKIDQVVKVLVTEDLLKQEKVVDSAIAMISIYRGTILNLYKKWTNYQQTASSNLGAEDMNVEQNDNVYSLSSPTQSTTEISVAANDDVIYDNLVIRYMMHDVMNEIHEKFLQITNLNP